MCPQEYEKTQLNLEKEREWQLMRINAEQMLRPGIEQYYRRERQINENYEANWRSLEDELEQLLPPLAVLRNRLRELEETNTRLLYEMNDLIIQLALSRR
jgi:hypothetical protein